MVLPLRLCSFERTGSWTGGIFVFLKRPKVVHQQQWEPVWGRWKLISRRRFFAQVYGVLDSSYSSVIKFMSTRVEVRKSINSVLGVLILLRLEQIQTIIWYKPKQYCTVLWRNHKPKQYCTVLWSNPENIAASSSIQWTFKFQVTVALAPGDWDFDISMLFWAKGGSFVQRNYSKNCNKVARIATRQRNPLTPKLLMRAWYEKNTITPPLKSHIN